jgi:hypothetical protein
VAGLVVSSFWITEAADAAPQARFRGDAPAAERVVTDLPFRSRSPALRAGESAAQPVEPPLPPAQFNPDPNPAAPETVPLLLFPDESQMPPDFGAEPIEQELELPRYRVEPVIRVEKAFEYRESKPGEGSDLPPFTRARTNRWFLGFGHWKRYQDPSIETTYQFQTPRTYHPYQQSILKGDVPVIGQDIFANLTLKDFALFEAKYLPTPSGVSAAQPNSSEFFGRGEQILWSNDTSVGFDLFKGETAFKPVHWAIRLLGVYNVNQIRVKENNLIDPDPRGVGFRDGESRSNEEIGGGAPRSGDDVNPSIQNTNSANLKPGDLVRFIAPDLRNIGKGDSKIVKGGRGKKDLAGTRYTTRTKDFLALQEAFVEIHLSDLSENYDFISSRAGIQPFVSDFRGFIFSDTNLGLRLFGNAENNLWQYNLLWFNMREKDTYSDLNTFEARDQNVIIANVFRQDFFTKGYTAQLSFHANIDEGEEHSDKNDFVVRPAVLGNARPKDVRAYYLGWTGDGHIGRLNVTHAFYQVFGEDELNGLAGRKTQINAQMAALELSYDRDWIRFKLSGFWASGDGDVRDGTARGFDSILDNPFFIGGPFSWYVHQGFNLAGTTVNLKQRNSLVPDLRSSKTEGQSNFVNPGVFILGAGTDIEVTPKLRAFANVNYIWLAETEPIQVALQTNKASNDLGLDCSLGVKYRPLLTDNVIFSLGLGLFFPGQGYKDIYRRATDLIEGFGPQDEPGRVENMLYNVFLTVTLTY